MTNPNTPPPGWSPSEDRDARWRGIARLMREADHPAVPVDAEFDALRDRILDEVADAAHQAPAPVVAASPAAERESFGGWAKGLATGGGWGANLVRLAAVGGVAFALGQSRDGRVSAPPPSPAAAPATQVAAVPPPDAATVADAPAALDASRFYWPATTGATLARDLRLPVAADTADEAIRAWEAVSIAPASFDWGGTVLERSPFARDGWSPPQPAGSHLAERVLDRMQELKFRLLLSDTDGALALLGSLESAVDDLLEEKPHRDAPSSAWMRFAEERLAAGDALGAVEAFEQAADSAEGSFGAFLATIQAASVHFEVREDYGAALRAYREAMEQYPNHFLTGEHKGPLLERIELLVENQSGDWAALRAWRRAQGLQGVERAEALLAAMEAAPRAPIAGRAALEAIALVCDEHPEAYDPQLLLNRLNNALREALDAPSAASLQFASGRLVHMRMANTALARTLYARSLAMPGAEGIAPQAEALVRALEPPTRQARAYEGTH